MKDNGDKRRRKEIRLKQELKLVVDKERKKTEKERKKERTNERQQNEENKKMLRWKYIYKRCPIILNAM